MNECLHSCADILALQLSSYALILWQTSRSQAQASYSSAVQLGRQGLQLLDLDLPESDFDTVRDEGIEEILEVIELSCVLFSSKHVEEMEKQAEEGRRYVLRYLICCNTV